MLFHDRTYAAFLLVNQLKQYKNYNGVVLALSYGGVPIGYQIAHLLNLPLDLMLKGYMINRRSQLMGGMQPIPLQDKTVILTDDGIANGNTVLAFIKNIRAQKPKKIIVAVPVASTSAYNALSTEVDEFINLLIPRNLNAVGEFYENFSQVSGEVVKRILNKARAEQAEIIPNRA